MMNNEKEKQNLEVVENQVALDETTISLEEQTKAAEIEEKNANFLGINTAGIPTVDYVWFYENFCSLRRGSGEIW